MALQAKNAPPEVSLADLDYDPHYEVPERQLLAAVLTRAIRDLFVVDLDMSRTNPVIVKRRAWRWFISVSHAPFSFRWVCQYLDLNPQAILLEIRSQKGRLNPNYAANPFL